MLTSFHSRPGRRRFLAGAAAATATVLAPAPFVLARPAPIRIGVLLPYSGTYAMLGTAITDGMKLSLAQAGETLAGRPVEYIIVDSEASPQQAPQNTRKLVVRDRVDVLVGPVHSGVALAMAQIVGARGAPLMIIPNAGADALTRELCAPNVFRSSFSNWQTGYPCGKVMADDGHRSIVTITWRYAAGDEIMGAGAEHFEALGGRVIKHIRVPFPDVSFQAHLSEIASLAPDAVFAFFSGGGAVQFVRDYAAAGLKARIPLYGPGFLTEGVAGAQGEAADGIRSTMHYVDDLDIPVNRRFRDAYRDAYGREADVFAVQGYDTGTLIARSATAVDGDTSAVGDMAAALEGIRLEGSPRGAWQMSPAHNPTQTFYLRDVVDGRHRVLGVAAEALADPATGCTLA